MGDRVNSLSVSPIAKAVHGLDENGLQSLGPALLGLAADPLEAALSDTPSLAEPAWSPDPTGRVQSRTVLTGGGAYRLWIDSPADEPPAQGRATLWVLDAATLFPIVSATARRLAARPDKTGVGAIMVVGVDHEPVEGGRRYADYTFGPPAFPASGDLPHGAGAQMLDFLLGEARGLVAATEPLDASRQFLLGHSLSGLFALHAAILRPEAFAAVGAVSPSVWWNVDALRRGLEDMSQGPRLFLAVGEREEEVSRGSTDRLQGRMMVTRARAMADIATEKLGGPAVDFHIAPDEDHASAVVSTLPSFLRFVSRP